MICFPAVSFSIDIDAGECDESLLCLKIAAETLSFAFELLIELLSCGFRTTENRTPEGNVGLEDRNCCEGSVHKYFREFIFTHTYTNRSRPVFAEITESKWVGIPL